MEQVNYDDYENLVHSNQLVIPVHAVSQDMQTPWDVCTMGCVHRGQWPDVCVVHLVMCFFTLGASEESRDALSNSNFISSVLKRAQAGCVRLILASWFSEGWSRRTSPFKNSLGNQVSIKYESSEEPAQHLYRPSRNEACIHSLLQNKQNIKIPKFNTLRWMSNNTCYFWYFKLIPCMWMCLWFCAHDHPT